MFKWRCSLSLWWLPSDGRGHHDEGDDDVRMTSDYLGDWVGKDNLHLRSFSEISHRTPWEPGALVFNSTYKQLFFPQIYLYSSVVTVIICSIIVGHVASMTPDFTQAKQAANRVFYLLDHVPPIDSYSNEGKQPVSESVIFWERGRERGRGREREREKERGREREEDREEKGESGSERETDTVRVLTYIC